MFSDQSVLKDLTRTSQINFLTPTTSSTTTHHTLSQNHLKKFPNSTFVCLTTAHPTSEHLSHQW